MAIVAHGHRIPAMTRFRVQVLSRAAVLFAAGVLSWLLPMRNASVLDAPTLWFGSAAIETRAGAMVPFVAVLAAVGFMWQRRRPAEMGALAWVVAGGLLAAASALLVVGNGLTEGPMYWWLGLGVVITSMALQVVATLMGHALATLSAAPRS